MKKCPKCEEGERVLADDIVNDMDGYAIVVSGEKFNNCGEEFINEKEGRRLIKVAKKLGVWGDQLKLHRKLSRSARGTVLRIPTDIERELKLKGNEKVEIMKTGRKIIVEIT